MNYVCGDNRFEIIERYKKELISATNIEGSPDEMAVLDNILFRFWQMGWLKEQKDEKERIMKVIWDVLHEGLSIDTVADQDWVYEQVRHRIEDI